MVIDQYTPIHRKYDHIGDINPNLEVSESVRTANEYFPAPWLPTQRFDKHYEDFFVLSAGKAVGCTRDRFGYLVPAGLAKAWADAGAGGTTVFTYSDNDVLERVQDIRTGAPLLAAATKAVTRDEIETAILGTTAGPSATNNPFSAPIGIAPYNYKKHPGGDFLQNPADLSFHNYRPQAFVTVLHDRHIELPLLPAQTATESLTTEAEWSALDTNKYCRPFDNTPIAKPTKFLPYTFSNTTAFANEVSGESDLTQNGDYYVDTATNQLCFYTDATDPTAGAGADALGTVDYYNYAAAPGTVGTYGAIVGDIRCGDKLKCNADSNFEKWIPGTDDASEIIGQALAFQRFPRGGLEKVRTAFEPGRLPSQFPWPSGAGDFDQAGNRDANPGSATGGLPSAVTYSGAANIMVRINLQAN